MSRGFRVLVVVSVLVASGALAAVLIYQEQVHGVAPVLGLALLVLGAAGTALHLTVSDDSLRRHVGEPGAAEVRRFWRKSWVGVLLGVASLGRYPQPATLDLSTFAGLVPVEVIGETEFPRITGEYVLTLGPYGFLVFRLQQAVAPIAESKGPALVVAMGNRANPARTIAGVFDDLPGGFALGQ